MVKQLTSIGYTDFYEVSIPQASKKFLISVIKNRDMDDDLHQSVQVWINDAWKPFIEMTNVDRQEVISKVEILLGSL